MALRRVTVAVFSALLFVSAGSRPEARVNDELALDAAAVREMLEGPSGRRETWTITPTLVVLSSVLDYERGDMTTGFPVTNRRLTPKEIENLRADLTTALVELSDGRLNNFHDVVVETPNTHAVISLFQPGRIVVGRFRGLRKKTGNLGYGGRAARRSGAIAGAVVMLDERADRDKSGRRLIRMHELGHALGYNHVTSRPSIMNPRAGSTMSDFDRTAIRQLAPQAFGLN
jgi:hypothetical protein